MLIRVICGELKLEDCYLFTSLFFFAIMAFHDAIILIYHMKDGAHRFIVGNTFRIGTFHDATKLIRHFYLFLFHYLVIADNVQFDVRCYYRNTVDLFVTKEFICNFDDPFFA